VKRLAAKLVWLVPVLIVLAVVACSAPVDPDLASLDRVDLANAREREEIMKLRFERGFIAFLPSAASLLTALIGIPVLLLAALRYFDERAKDRAARERQHEEDARQAQRESETRFDAAFHSAVERLGRAEAAIRVGALVTLMTYLKPEHSAFHEPIYELLLANVKVKEGNEDVRRVLVASFERALPLVVAAAPADGNAINLARADLRRLRVRRLDLTGVDLGRARLDGARFDGVTLRTARAYGVRLRGASFALCKLDEARANHADATEADFSGSRAVSSTFKDATLVSTRWRGTGLQGAHFERATLAGADFTDANLADAYFYNAELDDDALRSVLRAKRWYDAHWSATHWAWLAIHTQPSEFAVAVDQALSAVYDVTQRLTVLGAAARVDYSYGHSAWLIELSEEMRSIARTDVQRCESWLWEARAHRLARRYDDSVASAARAVAIAQSLNTSSPYSEGPRLRAQAAYERLSALLGRGAEREELTADLSDAVNYGRTADPPTLVATLLEVCRVNRLGGASDPAYAAELARWATGIQSVRAEIEALLTSYPNVDRDALAQAYEELLSAEGSALPINRYLRILVLTHLGRHARALGEAERLMGKSPIPHLAAQLLAEPVVDRAGRLYAVLANIAGTSP
jgi:uncharacterized protein YjbI with pentapeptide repeats